MLINSAYCDVHFYCYGNKVHIRFELSSSNTINKNLYKYKRANKIAIDSVNNSVVSS